MSLILMGPPGCGKTTALASAIFENLKENNLKKYNFMVLAYTHATLRALASKLKKFELDIKSSTLHSLAFSLCPRLDLLYDDDDDDSAVISIDEIANFFISKSLPFKITEYNEDPLSLFDTTTYTHSEQIGNRLYNAFRYIRHTVTSFEAFRYTNYWNTENYKLHFYQVYTTHCMKAFKIDLDVNDAYSIFCEYLEFLYESFKYDFEKMIEVAITELLNNNKAVEKIKKDGVKVIIVDEFQDMTNLMLLFVLCLSEHFDIWLSGDLDQMIYDFFGSDRSFILQSLRKISSWYIQLDVSHRVPELIFKKALALIGKDYKTSKPGGKIKIISQLELYDVLLKSMAEPTLFLCRVSHFFPHDLLNSLSLFYSYATKGTVNTNIPSWYNYYEELKNKELTRKNLHFFVKILQRLGYISILSAEDEIELVRIIKENGKTSKKMSKESKKTSKKNLLNDCARRVMYCLDRVDDVFYDYYRFQFLKVKNMRKSNLLLTTIHAAKGSESKNVIVDMRITKSCLDSKCEKNVLYVAFTRSSENLYLFMPTAGLSYFSVFNLL